MQLGILMKKLLLIVFVLLVLAILVFVFAFGKEAAAYFRTWADGRNTAVISYIRNPQEHRDWELEALSHCGDAPFALPTSGFIGYLYNDSFSPLKIHQGLDIFGGTEAGDTAVYAPYDGFLTREEGWKSSLIIRVPEDPLDPERQIWIYMTHLADAQGNSLIEAKFPPGASEIPVKTGELLGYQGNYSGNPLRPVGVHLHFSIVKDDGQGHYLNELKIENTLDPSPYFNIELNAQTAPKSSPTCQNN